MDRFGDLIRHSRIEKGWSQRELARRIKKSPTYIHYVERGYSSSAKADKMRVGESAVDDLARVLGIPVDEARQAAGYAGNETGTVLALDDNIKVIIPADVSPERVSKIEQAFRLALGLVQMSPGIQMVKDELVITPESARRKAS